MFISRKLILITFLLSSLAVSEGSRRLINAAQFAALAAPPRAAGGSWRLRALACASFPASWEPPRFRAGAERGAVEVVVEAVVEAAVEAVVVAGAVEAAVEAVEGA